jgi:hypothetical protein
MSLDQIIEVLPKLSHRERRELSLRLLELEGDDDLAVCDYLAAEGFARLDKMEAEDELARAKPKAKSKRSLAG